jgi:glutaredoxin 3
MHNSKRSAVSSLGGNPIDSIFSFLNEGKKKLVKSQAGNYDADAIQSKINNLIKENPVFMFSFTTCPFCIKAKAILDEKGAKYKVVELDISPDGKAIRAELADLVGRTSVPAIWIGGTFVGGCNDVSVNLSIYLSSCNFLVMHVL